MRRTPRGPSAPGESAIVTLGPPARPREKQQWAWRPIAGQFSDGCTGFRTETQARDDAFAHGYETCDVDGRMHRVTHKVLTRDEWRKTTALERLTCEQYDVMYDEPDERGEFGRRLVEIYEVTFDSWKNSHDLVMRRHMELHPRAVGVRVVYA